MQSVFLQHIKILWRTYWDKHFFHRWQGGENFFLKFSEFFFWKRRPSILVKKLSKNINFSPVFSLFLCATSMMSQFSPAPIPAPEWTPEFFFTFLLIYYLCREGSSLLQYWQFYGRSVDSAPPPNTTLLFFIRIYFIRISRLRFYENILGISGNIHHITHLTVEKER